MGTIRMRNVIDLFHHFPHLAEKKEQIN